MHTSGIILHGIGISGHVHRVRLLLEMLELPYRYIETDAQSRATPAYRALNPLGQVPVLEDRGLVLCDSNAILVYLVKRYAPDSGWLPENPPDAARVQRWLSIAAGELRHGPGTARRIALLSEPNDPRPAVALAEKLFAFMNAHLASRAFLAVEHPTIADLACYTYTAHAPEGGISLAPYPHVRGWLGRVEALPRFSPMPRSSAPLHGGADARRSGTPA
jgi:glutathione S-transferase